MSPVTCPNGHNSADAQWCDTCGAKIGGATSGAVAPAVPTARVPAQAAGPQGPTQACPHCDSSNPGDALFCEVCGYDFTTGQAPAPAAAPAGAPSQPVIGSTVDWIAVVEVDTAWYALKGMLADQPCPPASSSTVPLPNHTALVGRSSASRDIHPEIALDADTGVSRRHAQLVRDGERLTVVDLSSTNGTYVVAGGDEPAEATAALVPGVPHELHDGDRVYLGAWSRLTVRASA
ncbi:MAG: FHA domain-containing protein [Actinomycetota bacterium]|nr:FHA domain-containing protein [Actinomycetota bacterium]